MIRSAIRNLINKAIAHEEILTWLKINKPVVRYSGAVYPWVPITWVDTWEWSPVGPDFAKPKSESFALKSYMKNIWNSIMKYSSTRQSNHTCWPHINPQKKKWN